MKDGKQKIHLIQDLLIIFVSILIATILSQSNILNTIILTTQNIKYLGIFIAGMFFISAFTAAPAGVLLFEMAKSNPTLEVAFIGALGSVLGDYIIFHFVKDSLAEDISYILKKAKQKRLRAIIKLKLFRWLTPFIGALIIASPLPDEIGIAMMGLSKVKTKLFIPIAFLLDFLGIFILSILAKQYA